nr:D164 [uncultured bacterium]
MLRCWLDPRASGCGTYKLADIEGPELKLDESLSEALSEGFRFDSERLRNVLNTGFELVE